MKSNRTKETDISQSVKKKVWERDGERCIYCGSPYAMPNAHFIPRSHGGLGIEENIVTLCQNCHNKTDNTTERQHMLYFIERYLKDQYTNWDKDKLTYKK